jgi:hypothetical protein
VEATNIVGIVAAAIAAAAAWATFRQVQEAREQTRLQHQMRVDSVQPYIFADFRADKTQRALITVHLQNSGPTVGTNVRLTWKPELPTKHAIGGDGVAGLPPCVLPSMPPGRVMTWMLGKADELLNDDTVPRQYVVTVEADGPFGPAEPLTYTLSLDDMMHVLAIPGGSLHRIERAIVDAATTIADAQESRARMTSAEPAGG